MDLSIVVPVYNEAEGLPELLKRLTLVLDSMGQESEVILVDDGSTDSSHEVIAAYHQVDPRICGLFFSRNFGHQTAVSAGLQFARGKAVAVMDGDLQDPPEVLPLFFSKLNEGFDVVYGVRRKRKEHVFKRLSYHLFYRLLKQLSDYPIPLDAGDFSVMSRRIVDSLKAMPERQRFVRGLRAWAGYRQIGLEYERDARFSGTPKYTLKKLINLAVDGLLSFSSIPVRLIIQFGFLVAVSSLIAGIVYLVLKLLDIGTWPLGFATLVILIAFLGGIQLITIGMIGEYVGRIHMEVKQRPLFLVADYVGIEPLHDR